MYYCAIYIVSRNHRTKNKETNCLTITVQLSASCRQQPSSDEFVRCRTAEIGIGTPVTCQPEVITRPTKWRWTNSALLHLHMKGIYIRKSHYSPLGRMCIPRLQGRRQIPGEGEEIQGVLYKKCKLGGIGERCWDFSCVHQSRRRKWLGGEGDGATGCSGRKKCSHIGIQLQCSRVTPPLLVTELLCTSYLPPDSPPSPPARPSL